jgi:hypothetical protein
MCSANSYFAHAATGDLEFVVSGDLAAHPKGAALVAELEELAQSGTFQGGKQMTACLEAVKGQPLLVARVSGMHGWMQLIQAFQAAGLVDRLEEDFFHHEPFDAIFS